MVQLLKQVFAIENNWKNVFYVHTLFCLHRSNYMALILNKPGKNWDCRIITLPGLPLLSMKPVERPSKRS
jgi:hypothetical protein